MRALAEGKKGRADHSAPGSKDVRNGRAPCKGRETRGCKIRADGARGVVDVSERDGGFLDAAAKEVHLREALQAYIKSITPNNNEVDEQDVDTMMEAIVVGAHAVAQYEGLEPMSATLLSSLWKVHVQESVIATKPWVFNDLGELQGAAEIASGALRRVEMYSGNEDNGKVTAETCTRWQRHIDAIDGGKSRIEVSKDGIVLAIDCGKNSIRDVKLTDEDKKGLAFNGAGQKALLNLIATVRHLNDLTMLYGLGEQAALVLLKQHLLEEAKTVAQPATTLKDALQALLNKYSNNAALAAIESRNATLKQGEGERLLDFIQRATISHEPFANKIPQAIVIMDGLRQDWREANYTTLALMQKLDCDSNDSLDQLRGIMATRPETNPRPKDPDKKNQGVLKSNGGKATTNDGADKKKKSDGADKKGDKKKMQECCKWEKPNHHFNCRNFKGTIPDWYKDKAKKKNGAVLKKGAAGTTEPEDDGRLGGEITRPAGREDLKQYVVLLLPNARELIAELDSGAQNLIPYNIVERLELVSKIQPRWEEHACANGSPMLIEGFVDLPFILNDTVYSLRFDILKTLNHTLLNWDALQAQIPGCSYVSGDDRRDDKRSIAGVEYSFEDGTKNVWVPRTIGAATINLIVGDQGTNIADEVPVELGEYAFGEDPAAIRAKEEAELPRIIGQLRDAKCPGHLIARAENSLKRSIDITVCCLSAPPKDRGDDNMRITLLPDAKLVKEKQWTERDPNRLEARVKWEENLLKSNRAYLADPSEVEAISNVTTPLNGNFWEDRKYRPCGAFVKLNDATAPIARDIPTINGYKDSMSPYIGAQWKSDTEKGYYMVMLEPELQVKAAMWSVTYLGKVLVPRVMMYGFKNAPFVFDKVMDTALRGLDVHRIVDDVIAEGKFSPTTTDKTRQNEEAWTDAVTKFEEFVNRCDAHDIPLSLQKTEFGTELKVLGGIRTLTGFKPDPERIQALKELPEPKTKAELRSVMVLLRYFQEHSPGLQTALGPLNQLVSKTTWTWGSTESTAWSNVLNAVQQAILTEPFIYGRKTAVIPDASNDGRGFWLVQIDSESRLHIIKLKSRAWNKGQRTWSTIHKECVSLIEAVHDCEKFLHYTDFTVFTDHKPLLWLLRQTQTSPTMWGGAALRYVMYLTQFNMKIEHVAGQNNLVADMLSRYPFQRATTEDDASADAPFAQWKLLNPILR